MIWSKILTIIQWIYKIIVFLIHAKKGQVSFASIPLDKVEIEFFNDSHINIANVQKINFNENNLTVSVINGLGSFVFNVEQIKTIKFTDTQKG